MHAVRYFDGLKWVDLTAGRADVRIDGREFRLEAETVATDGALERARVVAHEAVTAPPVDEDESLEQFHNRCWKSTPTGAATRSKS